MAYSDYVHFFEGYAHSNHTQTYAMDREHDAL